MGKLAMFTKSSPKQTLLIPNPVSTHASIQSSSFFCPAPQTLQVKTPLVARAFGDSFATR